MPTNRKGFDTLLSHRDLQSTRNENIWIKAIMQNRLEENINATWAHSQSHPSQSHPGSLTLAGHKITNMEPHNI